MCSRHRALTEGDSGYVVLTESLLIRDDGVRVDVLNEHNHIVFILDLIPLTDSTLRVKLNERNPLHARFEEPFAVLGPLKVDKFEVTNKTVEGFTLLFGNNRVDVYARPLRIDVFKDGEFSVSINNRGLLKFEHYRRKPQGNPEEEGVLQDQSLDLEPDQDGLWEEVFKSHTDAKPMGPSSVGLDVAFPESNHVYGIPEHADDFSLKDTSSTDPYRLYNLDVFEYELDNPMALYGSIPVMFAHSARRTAAVFWHNAAETWVDVKKYPDSNVVSTIAGFFGSRHSNAGHPLVSSHWISESGIIDLFIMLGPQPMDVFRQYAVLTGTTPLPPLFSIGYHQCRWNYNDEEDVKLVNANFDRYDLPMDVLWLDIEHTDGKRYFTWDSAKFPNPSEMTADLVSKGRKLVTIVDPHIKRDANYFFYKENQEMDFFVKSKDNNEYDGWCWPGSSSYVDFTNPAAREHYINTFSLDRYQGSTLDTFTWNDMNEPSVFNGPEVTMQKDNIHPGLGVEHREIHNVYGMLFHQSTYEGQLRRSSNRLRPFLLTRAHYAGTQRTAAVWTGDNTADWGHLRASQPMLLSLSVVGVTHVGADVGGFFGNPDAHLLTRWYQAGAFQPFFRAHAHLDTKRREPWLFDNESMAIIRAALRARYAYLPLWYTLFYENQLTGAPPMRPLWANFPSDEKCFAVESVHMIGSALLVRPVTEEGAVTATVYFPPGIWFDVINRDIYHGASQTVSVEAPRNKIPVYQRGGSIVPRKERIRRASSLMRDDPYTLVVALDENGTAQGTLYIDDEHTFDYTKGKFLYLSLEYTNGQLRVQKIDKKGYYATGSWLERVVVWGLEKQPSKVVLESGSETRELEIQFEAQNGSRASQLTIRKPGVSMQHEFVLQIIQ